MYIPTAPEQSKEVVGYKLTYVVNGKPRQRVFMNERRASRFRRGLPYDANSRLVPVLRSPRVRRAATE